MKKLFIILTILSLFACGENKNKDVVNQANTEISQLQDSINALNIQLTDCKTMLEAEPADTNKYFVVVGAFKVEWRADKYVGMVNDLGYTAEKSLSHYGFYNVFVKAGTDKKKAIEIMENIREKGITQRCWVYVKR